jgi:hypothetical protein
MPTLADRLTDSERASLRSIAEAEAAAELAAVQATVEALGWRDCEGTDTMQCMCGHIGAASEFLARRIAQGRGPRVTLCRECATRR